MKKLLGRIWYCRIRKTHSWRIVALPESAIVGRVIRGKVCRYCELTRRVKPRRPNLEPVIPQSIRKTP